MLPIEIAFTLVLLGFLHFTGKVARAVRYGRSLANVVHMFF